MNHTLTLAAAALLLVSCSQPGIVPLQPGPQGVAAMGAAPLVPVLSAADLAKLAALLAKVEAEGRANPTNLGLRRFEPLLRLQTGDQAGWARSRIDLTEAWARLRGTGAPAPMPPSFLIDLINSGDKRILVDQCYERAGRWGVLYRFTVVSPDGQVHAFFTVEQSDFDAQVARELHHPVGVTLDYFTPGGHATVAILDGTPDYGVLRARVLGFMADGRVVSSSSGGPPVLSNEGCSLSPPG